MVFCLLPANRGDVSFMSLKTPLLRFLWPNCDAFLSFFALITCFHLFAAELVRSKPYLPEDVFAKLLNFLLITPKIRRVFWLNYAVFRFITIKRSFTGLSLNLVAFGFITPKKVYLANQAEFGFISLRTTFVWFFTPNYALLSRL